MRNSATARCHNIYSEKFVSSNQFQLKAVWYSHTNTCVLDPVKSVSIVAYSIPRLWIPISRSPVNLGFYLITRTTVLVNLSTRGPLRTSEWRLLYEDLHRSVSWIKHLTQCGPNPGPWAACGPRTTFVRPSTTLTIVACLVSCNTTWSVKIILKTILSLIRIKNKRLTFTK